MTNKKRVRGESIQVFSLRLPEDIWFFLKKTSMEQRRSMRDIIVNCVSKYKERTENSLTSNDTDV